MTGDSSSRWEKLPGLRRFLWRAVYPEATAYVEGRLAAVRPAEDELRAELRSDLAVVRARIDEVVERCDELARSLDQARSAFDSESQSRLQALVLDVRATNSRIDWLEDKVQGPAT